MFADESSPVTMWAALAGIITAFSGLIIAAMRQRAQERAAEAAAAKKDMNALYVKWKEIAELFKDEKAMIQKQYEEKCVECIRLTIQIEELRKKENND